MKGLGRGLPGLLFVGVLAVGLAGLGVWRLGTASGVGATLSIAGAPSSVTAGGPAFQVEIRVEGVANLGTYEWHIEYDPAVVELTEPAAAAVVNGPFLGSTGRTVLLCQLRLPPSSGLGPGEVRFGCGTIGASKPGPSGAGLLSTVAFRPVGSGSPNIGFVCAGLADPFAENIPVDNVPPCVSPVTPTATPGGPVPTPQPSITPGGPTVTPGGPTATPGALLPTATPEVPLATPTPLPPGMEAVDLAAACNPVAATYPNATPVQTIAGAVGPAGNLQALWEFGGNAWLGYSPAYPQASDLTAMDFLDVVFICVGGPGSFARPIV